VFRTQVNKIKVIDRQLRYSSKIFLHITFALQLYIVETLIVDVWHTGKPRHIYNTLLIILPITLYHI
jgi:hypothetical protein